MKTYDYSELSQEEIRELLKRPKIDFTSIFQTVQPILDSVEHEGDEAIKKYTRQFDDVNLDSVVINPKEVEVSLDKETKEAIDIAFNNIFRFHKAQFSSPIEVETMHLSNSSW
jgi:histidinol dehydrogenase